MGSSDIIPMWVPIAGCFVLDDGTLPGTQRGILSAVRSALGVYEVKTQAAIPTGEALPIATIADKGFTIETNHLGGDTFQIRTTDTGGLDADCAFWFLVLRTG